MVFAVSIVCREEDLKNKCEERLEKIRRRSCPEKLGLVPVIAGVPNRSEM
jgi:hypothetical protein